MRRNLPVIKRRSNPNCIYLITTSSSSSFQNTKIISTSFSDFHKMVITVLKKMFRRSSPKELDYRDFKNYDRFAFKRELKKKLNQQINEYRHFQKIFLGVLNTQAPTKRKWLRANRVLQMTKALRKVRRKMLGLEKNVQKIRQVKTLFLIKNTLTSAVSKYYEKFDLKNATCKKEFWKTVKPFLYDKVPNFPKIKLAEKRETISHDSKIANSFSDFFDSLKMLYVHLVSKQTNILMTITV